MQLLNAPVLKKLVMLETYLTKSEADTMIAALHQRRFGMHKVESITWSNTIKWEELLEDWMADEAHFNLVLNTLEIVYPQIELLRGKNITNFH